MASQALGELSSTCPLDWARTEAGARLVEEILAKIDWGAARLSAPVAPVKHPARARLHRGLWLAAFRPLEHGRPSSHLLLHSAIIGGAREARARHRSWLA